MNRNDKVNEHLARMMFGLSTNDLSFFDNPETIENVALVHRAGAPMYVGVTVMISDFLLAGIKDKSNAPLSQHAFMVALPFIASGDYSAAMVALLHDVIEDAPDPDLVESMIDSAMTEFIKDPEMQFTQEDASDIQDDVHMLTRKDGEPYFTYIFRLIEDGSATALRVKVSDLVHNMDMSRLWIDESKSDNDYSLEPFGLKDVKRQCQYATALELICETLVSEGVATKENIL